jgi:hypothetical protein
VHELWGMKRNGYELDTQHFAHIRCRYLGRAATIMPVIHGKIFRNPIHGLASIEQICIGYLWAFLLGGAHE